jgi:hypothetical protein
MDWLLWQKDFKAASIQAVAWLLLAAFSPDKSENSEHKSRTERFLKRLVCAEKKRV